MNNGEFERLAGMVSKVSYAMMHEENISEDTRELFRDLWIGFSGYEENND